MFCGKGFSFQNIDFASKNGPGVSLDDPDLEELTKINPEDLGLDALALKSGIKSIIREAIDSAAFPGCQILLAKDGKIFYEESFGYHTYDSLRPVKNTDIYDLASVTKTTAATLSLMKLYDDGIFDPDQTFGRYFRR